MAGGAWIRGRGWVGGVGEVEAEVELDVVVLADDGSGVRRPIVAEGDAGDMGCESCDDDVLGFGRGVVDRLMLKNDFEACPLAETGLLAFASSLYRGSSVLEFEP
jgi:hypothetical protein